MLMHIAYKYRLYPNKTQQVFFSKTFGCCRKIWNLLLSDYNNTNKVNTSLVPYKEQFIYLKDTDSNALSQVWNYFTKAIKSYYNIPYRNKPKYKKKNSVQSYTTSCINNNIRIEGYNPYINKKKAYIHLPKIGNVKMTYHRLLPHNSIIKHITVTKTLTNEYYISINVEYDNQIIPNPLDIDNSIGLDYSLSKLIVSSNNIQYEYEKKYRINQDKLAKYQRLRDKAKYGSKKRHKFTMKLRRLHRDIANQRNDYLHKLSCYLSLIYDYVFIENLDLSKMASSHNKYKLGKSVYDSAYSTFRIFLNYKLLHNGYKQLVIIDKYYPSTQLCSYCGYRNILLRNNLSIRKWKCPNCNTVHDRDVNAAINILNRGIHLYHKYMKYISQPQHYNVSINDYILHMNELDPVLYHPVLQEIAYQVPIEQRTQLPYPKKKEIVYQVPIEQRKKQYIAPVTKEIVYQVPIEQRKKHIDDIIPVE